jgi:hypothetical protein
MKSMEWIFNQKGCWIVYFSVSFTFRVYRIYMFLFSNFILFYFHFCLWYQHNCRVIVGDSQNETTGTLTAEMKPVFTVQGLRFLIADQGLKELRVPKPWTTANAQSLEEI